MVICNRERIKTIESDESFSEIDPCPKNQPTCCENKLDNPDLIDFRTQMDSLSFYEKTDFQPCDDLWFISNEETLWQCLVGEIKTPLHALRNSIGQANYGCEIWSLIGENIDALEIQQFKYYIKQTCLKYPEIRNVVGLEIKISDDFQTFLVEIIVDSIYGKFDGTLRIPNAHPSNKRWVSSSEIYHS